MTMTMVIAKDKRARVCPDDLLLAGTQNTLEHYIHQGMYCGNE